MDEAAVTLCASVISTHSWGAPGDGTHILGTKRGKLDAPFASVAGRKSIGAALSLAKVSAPREVGERDQLEFASLKAAERAAAVRNMHGERLGLGLRRKVLCRALWAVV